MDFKTYIKQQRDEFDRIERVPSEAIWHGIQQRRQKRRRIRRFIYTAAAAIVFLGILTPTLINRPGPANEELFVNDEILETERAYYQLTSHKKTEMQFELLDANTYGELITELDTLDAMYSQFKQDLLNQPGAEQMVATAIRFHERRLRILELIEKEIENQKRSAAYENEILL